MKTLSWVSTDHKIVELGVPEDSSNFTSVTSVVELLFEIIDIEDNDMASSTDNDVISTRCQVT